MHAAAEVRTFEGYGTKLGGWRPAVQLVTHPNILNWFCACLLCCKYLFLGKGEEVDIFWDASNKVGTMQRVLRAWPLCEDGTHKSGSVQSILLAGSKYHSMP
eukprot:4029794-Amphidinium_carterae.1